MVRIKKQHKKIIWVISAGLGLIVLIIGILISNENLRLDDFLFLAGIIALFPPAVTDILEARWKKGIDNHLPDLFRSIVQAQKTGMTLPNALEEASKRDYGPLTSELKKVVHQMSWGHSFEDAFRDFGERVDTELVRGNVPLIIEASRSGGRVEKIFAPMSGFIRSTLSLQKERKAQSRPYIAIIYVSFYVFVLTIIMLYNGFFRELASEPIIGMTGMAPDEAGQVFVHMSFIQAFFGGLMAGKIGEGSVMSGLKHSLILLVSGYLALKLVAW
jgi:flagellar protein FlaJ